MSLLRLPPWARAVYQILQCPGVEQRQIADHGRIAAFPHVARAAGMQARRRHHNRAPVLEVGVEPELLEAGQVAKRRAGITVERVFAASRLHLAGSPAEDLFDPTSCL